jgi:hypothetical protein
MDFPTSKCGWFFHMTPLGGRDRRGLGAAGSRGTHLGGDAARALVPEAATSTSKPFFHMQNGTSTFPQYATLFCCYRLLKTINNLGTFTLKYPYLKRISWPLLKEAFLRVFEIG